MPSKNIQWHPGFYAGMELDLRGNALEFEKEFQLTKGPLSIDLLIIRNYYSGNQILPISACLKA